MEFILSLTIGILMASGIYLVLKAQSYPVILGLSLMTYAVNIFIFAMGRVSVNQPPLTVKDAEHFADPLPQALVLTAIVISFGMTAVIVVMALRSYIDNGTDEVDL